MAQAHSRDVLPAEDHSDEDLKDLVVQGLADPGYGLNHQKSACYCLRSVRVHCLRLVGVPQIPGRGVQVPDCRMASGGVVRHQWKRGDVRPVTLMDSEGRKYGGWDQVRSQQGVKVKEQHSAKMKRIGTVGDSKNLNVYH